MIVSAPPLEMSQQVWGLQRRRPGATSQRGYSMSAFQQDRKQPAAHVAGSAGDKDLPHTNSLLQEKSIPMRALTDYPNGEE